MSKLINKIKKIFRRRPDLATRIMIDGADTDPVYPSADAGLSWIRFGEYNAMNPSDDFCYRVTFSDPPVLTVTCGEWNEEEKYETVISPDEAERAAGLARQAGINLWNGFHGCDRNVCDGGGFSLEAEYSDGTAVSASGSNAYPNDYGILSSGLTQLFQSYLNQYSFDRLPKEVFSDDLYCAIIHFKQYGRARNSEFSFQFYTDRSPNVSASFTDADGEFDGTTGEPQHFRCDCPALDLSGIHRVVRKTDLPALNGFRQFCESGGEYEWYQIELLYSDDEHISLNGSVRFDRYEERRSALLCECIALVARLRDEKQET